MLRPLLITCSLTLLAGCSGLWAGDGETPYGKVSFSEDGRTYLSVNSTNGGRCNRVVLDGHYAHRSFGEQMEISPGTHTLSCGVEVTFKVPKGTLYSLNRWQAWQ